MKVPTKRLTLAQLGEVPAPAEVLSADATNEQVTARIRAKAIAALNKSDRLNREEWQIVSALWDRLQPKNKVSEEEKLSAGDAKRITEVYDAIFAGEYCSKCHRGTKR